MSLYTVEQLRANNNFVFSGATRFRAFERGDHLKETIGPPSLLLLIRNINVDASNPNIERVLNQVRSTIGKNCRNLKPLDFDLVRGETRTFLGHNNSIAFINEFNAAVVKIQSLITKYEDEKQDTDEDTWFVQGMRDCLGFDYTTVYGNQRNSFNEILQWTRVLVASRFRHLNQTTKWDPLNTYDTPIRRRMGIDCNRQQHVGLFLLDAALGLSGSIWLLTDGDSRSLDERDAARRRALYHRLFRSLYHYSVYQAMRLGIAMTERDGKTNNPNLADVFLWLVEYTDKFNEWYATTTCEISMMGAKDYAGPSLQPVYTAYRNLSQDVVIALAQREDFGGITAYMWGRILTKMDLVTGLARSLVTVPARNRTTDRMEDREIGYGKWIAKYYGPPSQNYPALSREMPVLAPESIARNVPRDQDGGGPDGGDYSDGDDNDNNDGGGGDGGNGGNNDNNNDNDGGGDDGGNGGNGDNDDSTFVDYWDDPRFDGPNTEGNTEGAESSSDDSDSDGEGGAGGERSGVPGGGGAGHHRHNGRDGSWAAVCKRCIHISSEEMCHMCGGEVLPVYKPIKGRNKRMRAMLAHENDDSIDSPNKRVQSLLSSQAIIDNLTDQLRKARLNLREGPGTSMATIHFDHPDSSRQRGPEFEDFSRKENRL